MEELPIACTLGAGDMADRRDAWEALLRDAALGRERLPHGARVRLCDAPGIAERARALIAAEGACCAFLAFDLGADDGALRLDVTGPDDARPIIDGLLAL